MFKHLSRDDEPTAPLHSGGLTPSPLRGGFAVRQGPRADGLAEIDNQALSKLKNSAILTISKK